jgi:hypothetical protein
MLILPQLFFGGSGADIIAVSTSGSRPVKSSKSGASWRDLGNNFLQQLGFGGGAFGETVSVGTEAFICNASGELYKTTDFRTFTRVNIVSIPNGAAPNFAGQAYLFKDPAYPSRLYASALSAFAGAAGIWYSDDLGLNWIQIALTAGSGTSISNWIIIGDYFYCGISVSGNSGVTLYRFNRFNFSNNGQVSNASIPILGFLHSVNGNRLNILNGSLYWTDNPLSGGNFVSLPTSFNGFYMSGRLISGTLRHVMIGIRNDTGRLAIIYTGASPESGGWQYATVSVIALGAASQWRMKVIPLSKQEGFVASYIDASDNTPSGILYSSDGITWTEADAGNLTNYLNIMVNPLII